jgi:hypothetical protein
MCAQRALGTAQALAKSTSFTSRRSNRTPAKALPPVWFVFDGTDVFVVTSSSPATKAIQRGWNRARMWVGDGGNWTNAKDAFRKAPELVATGTLITDADKQKRYSIASATNITSNGSSMV